MAFSVIFIICLQTSKLDIVGGESGGGGLLGGIKNSIGHVTNQIEVSIMQKKHLLQLYTSFYEETEQICFKTI